MDSLYDQVFTLISLDEENEDTILDLLKNDE